MKNNFVIASFIIALASVASESAVASTVERLASQRIHEMFAGKRLESLPSQAPSVEDFYANGKWFTWRGGRYARNQYGTWSIRSNRLCVAVDGVDVDCRSVWTGPSPATVSMRVPSSWKTGSAVVVRRVTTIIK